MEATAFALGRDRVLKVYRSTAAMPHLITLRDFYQVINCAAVPFALPRLLQIDVEDGALVTIEMRLAGRPLWTALQKAAHVENEYDVWRPTL